MTGALHWITVRASGAARYRSPRRCAQGLALGDGLGDVVAQVGGFDAFRGDRVPLRQQPRAQALARAILGLEKAGL